MSAPLVSINRFKCANPSGLVTLKLVVPEDVASLNSPTAEAGVTVVPGATIYHLELDPRSGAPEERKAGGIHGDFYRRTLGLSIRKQRQEVVTLRRGLMNRRVHLIFTDEDGYTYLWLNMRLRRDDSRLQSRNGYDFTFEGSAILPASFVQGEMIADPVVAPDTGSDTDDGNLPDAGGENTGDGTTGGNPGDDIGGGTTDPGDGGGGTDPDPPVYTGVVVEQPSTGRFYDLILGPCEEPIFNLRPE